MTKEEIKSKLALTPEQKELVEKCNELVKEMKENNIGIVFNYSLDSLSFAAFNNSEVLEMDNEDELSSDSSEDIEDAVEFGNIFNECIYIYDSYYGNLHAVFGDKTTLNESMMSASL